MRCRAALFRRRCSRDRRGHRRGACEGAPALEHVVHGLCQIVTAGEPGALLAHIGFQIGDERRALRLADSLSVVGTLAIDRALDGEECVDAAHDFDRNRREGDLLLASSLTSRVFLKIRHGEERAPGMDPTERLCLREERREACPCKPENHKFSDLWRPKMRLVPYFISLSRRSAVAMS